MTADLERPLTETFMRTAHRHGVLTAMLEEHAALRAERELNGCCWQCGTPYSNDEDDCHACDACRCWGGRHGNRCPRCRLYRKGPS